MGLTQIPSVLDSHGMLWIRVHLCRVLWAGHCCACMLLCHRAGLCLRPAGCFSIVFSAILVLLPPPHSRYNPKPLPGNPPPFVMNYEIAQSAYPWCQLTPLSLAFLKALTLRNRATECRSACFRRKNTFYLFLSSYPVLLLPPLHVRPIAPFSQTPSSFQTYNILNICIYIHVTIYIYLNIDCTHERKHATFAFLSLISFNMISSSIHFPITDTSFLTATKWISITYLYHIYFSHSVTDVYLDWFCTLDIVI